MNQADLDALAARASRAGYSSIAEYALALEAAISGDFAGSSPAAPVNSAASINRPRDAQTSGARHQGTEVLQVQLDGNDNGPNGAVRP